MIRLDGMSMIGSAGADVGKTELSCALLRKFSKNHNLIGIKVTAITNKDGQCPRGGQGCGVCSSLEGVYCITEETNSNSNKDTSKLLAAGASRVFWLRALREHFLEASTALLDVIGPDTISICESNSLRQVIEPGLFLMVRNRNLKRWKSSAQHVKKYADKIVTSDGGSFDFDLDRIKIINNRWVIQSQATAIIMAGGGSRRMGTDKSMLLINGRPIIERICEQLRGSFEHILISADDVEKFSFLGFEVVPDKVPGQGPLMGIASALEASSNEINFVMACDIPHIELGYIRRMLDEAVDSKADIVLPTAGNGKYEPLFAIYRKSALEAIKRVLSLGGRKISEVFTRCTVKYIELENADWLVNLNTLAEYEEFQTKHGNKI